MIQCARVCVPASVRQRGHDIPLSKGEGTKTRVRGCVRSVLSPHALSVNKPASNTICSTEEARMNKTSRSEHIKNSLILVFYIYEMISNKRPHRAGSGPAGGWLGWVGGWLGARSSHAARHMEMQRAPAE